MEIESVSNKQTLGSQLGSVVQWQWKLTDFMSEFAFFPPLLRFTFYNSPFRVQKTGSTAHAIRLSHTLMTSQGSFAWSHLKIDFWTQITLSNAAYIRASSADGGLNLWFKSRILCFRHFLTRHNQTHRHKVIYESCGETATGVDVSSQRNKHEQPHSNVWKPSNGDHVDASRHGCSTSKHRVTSAKLDSNQTRDYVKYICVTSNLCVQWKRPVA